MGILIKIKNGRVSLLSNNRFNKFSKDNIIHFSTHGHVNITENISEFCKNNNGITLIETEKSIEIYNDPFRTIPIYITQSLDGDIILFSDFEDFFTLSNTDKTIDKAGLWEIVLFEGALDTRTLYSSVKQMISASKIIINKELNDYTIERYWDFNIQENNSISNMDEAAEGLYKILNEIFSKIDENKTYIMGLSGGMDSRLTLAFLKKHLSPEKVNLFTYGYDERILEYQFAKQVAEIAGFEKPQFHKLDYNSYKNAVGILPKESCVHVGFHHCHILDFLIREQKSVKGKIFISNNYSDAAFGFATESIKQKDIIENTSYYKILESIDFLEFEVLDEIKKDIGSIFNQYSYDSNYSTMDEYKYVIERNQKFHMNMTYIHSKCLETISPYANFKLLNYMMSMPIQLRCDKELIKYVMDKYFPKIGMINNLSSRDFRSNTSSFQWNKKISGKTQYYFFKLLNRLNLILIFSTNGSIQMLNKYLTENQVKVFYKYFKNDLKEALLLLQDDKLISHQQKQYFSKLPLRSSKLGMWFQIIGLAEMIK